jgi:hypothetical protein
VQSVAFKKGLSGTSKSCIGSNSNILDIIGMGFEMCDGGN